MFVINMITIFLSKLLQITNSTTFLTGLPTVVIKPSGLALTFRILVLMKLPKLTALQVSALQVFLVQVLLLENGNDLTYYYFLLKTEESAEGMEKAWNSVGEQELE